MFDVMLLKAAGPMLKTKLPELQQWLESKRTELIKSGVLQGGEDIAIAMVQMINSPQTFAIGLLKIGVDGNASFFTNPIETLAIVNVNEPDAVIELMQKIF